MTNDEALCLVPWLGGKQAMVPKLLKLIPAGHMCYVELFGGGGALLLNKPKSPIEVFNDIDGGLVNLFEVVRNNPDEFQKAAEGLLFSRELYERWKTEELAGKATKDPVERALRYWYCVRSSFGGSIAKGWAYARDAARDSPLVLQNSLPEIKVIGERLKSVEIDHLDFIRCIENRDSPTTFFFIDPPYYGTTEYSCAAAKFPLERHYALWKLISRMKGKWLMTVGDHPSVHDIYTSAAKHVEIISSKCQVRKDIDTERGDYDNLVLRNYDLPIDSVSLPKLGEFQLTASPTPTGPSTPMPKSVVPDPMSPEQMAMMRTSHSKGAPTPVAKLSEWPSVPDKPLTLTDPVVPAKPVVKKPVEIAAEKRAEKAAEIAAKKKTAGTLKKWF